MTDDILEQPDEEPEPEPGDGADEGTVWPDEDDPEEQEVL